MDQSTNLTKKEYEMNATLKDEKFNHNPVLFAFAAPAAKQVSLAGDFNNWDSHAMPMRKGANGVWHLSVALKPGRHEYRSSRTECGRTTPPLNKGRTIFWAARTV